jgi:hypothetical protein
VQVRALPIEPLEDFHALVTAGLAVPRTPGVHVSDLVGCVMRSINPKGVYGTPTGEFGPAYWEMGYAWERMVGLAMGERLAVQQGWMRAPEMRSPEGIYYTPDWLNFEPDEMEYAETKATWKSSRDLDDHGSWLKDEKWLPYYLQMLSYAHLGQVFETQLYVFFVIGDYTTGPKPVRRRWGISVSPRECDETWDMMCNHGKKAGLL